MSFDFKISGGDIEFDTTGTPVMVYDSKKLRQDLIKIILTPLGSNKAYPWYGSPISEKTIGKTLDPKILDFEMRSSLMYAINNLMELQKVQSKDGQYLSPGEVIAQIKEVRVEPSIYDGRQFNITIVIATRRGDLLNESFTLTA
jgi:phage baseplate assembly protein W